jgi:hypothetical protein
MATIPQVERNVAMDGLCRVSGEDPNVGGRILHFMNTSFPAFDWIGILRNRAAVYPPFIASGLSTSAWCDEVNRQALVLAGG